MLFCNQNNHYWDDGCLCDVCKIKRNEYNDKFNKGALDINNENITHKFDDKYYAPIAILINNITHIINVNNF